MKEADMLESHIFQARARAVAAKKEAYERMKEEMEDFCDQPSLFTGASAVQCCFLNNMYAVYLTCSFVSGQSNQPFTGM